MTLPIDDDAVLWSRARDRWAWVRMWLAAPAAELSQGARLVLWTLVSYMDARGRCYPSARAIGERAAMSERRVRDHLHALESAGWVRTHRRGRGFVYTASTPDDSSGVPAVTPDESSGVEDVENVGGLASTQDGASGVPAVTPDERDSDTGRIVRCKEQYQEPSNAAAADGPVSAEDRARAVDLRVAERRRLIGSGRAKPVESWSAWRARVGEAMSAAEVREVLEAERAASASLQAEADRAARSEERARAEREERAAERARAAADPGPSLAELAAERGGMFGGTVGRAASGPSN